MITAHIATIPERIGSLKQVIDALLPQVDKIYVMLNGHTEVLSFLQELPNVHYEMCDNSLGDAAKWLHVNDEPAISVILDDDLIVANNFVKYMLYGLKKHGGAVSLHGKCYKNRPIKSFKRDITGIYRCLGSVGKDTKVDVIGTGCMAFSSYQVLLDNSIYQYKNMADILFSRLCFRNNIPMTVLEHKAGQFLTYIPQKNTIWRETKDDTLHTKILNTFIMNWGVL